MDLGAIKKLKKIFKEEKPDIVHAHSSMSGKIAAYLAGVKSRMYTRHCAYDPPRVLTTFPGKQINGLVNNTLSTKIIAVAEAAKQNLTDTGVDERKITVIINGVEALKPVSPDEQSKLKAKYVIGENDFVFGIVARLEAVKGQKYFIEAAKKMLRKYENLKFIIAGTGAMENEYKRLSENNPNIIFTGFIENVAEIFSIIDVNVNCSYGTETSSLALSEGMSLKKPAIASIYGGNPYMVTDGFNGYLCEKQNTDALFKKMEKLYTDRDEYKKMSENAYTAYNEKFTASKMTKTLEEIYEKEYERITKGKKKNG